MRTLKLKPDPRHYQIAVLGSLVVCGIVLLGFPISVTNALLILFFAQATQFAASLATRQHFDPKSAMITALSLMLLFRSSEVAWFVAAAIIAISSKFLLRINGKHVFNPANSAIVLLMLLRDDVWVSTGQWGNTTIAAFALACCGFLVLTRAKRAETTLAFLACYAALLFGRALWLGDPLTIPAHQIQNGALLLFAFFMISDPKTAPDAALGRVLYGCLVAAVGFTIQFTLYKPYGPLLALFCCAPLVPLLDLLLRGARYQWHAANHPSRPDPKELYDANTDTALHSSRHLYH
ncbi:MAG: RnfABCDGE type electron transport complex subunit D [Woeseia sp.]